MEDLKKDFFSTLDSFSYLYQSSKNALFSDKFTIKSFAEINFEEYQNGLKIPEIFRQKLDPVKTEPENDKKGILACLESILREKEERKMFEKYEVREEVLREVFGLENSEDHGIFLKVEAEIKKILEITLFVKIPADHPFEYF